MDDVSILFCGAQAEVEGLLNGREYDAQRVSIVDAPDIITNHESPTLAIRRKLNSSMVRAMDLVKKGEADAVVTAGRWRAAFSAWGASAASIVRRWGLCCPHRVSIL